MKKLALLIGVGNYEYDLNPLPGALKDVDAMQRVLQHPDMGDFSPENVTVLKNPPIQSMAMEIESTFSNCQNSDLILLYFSGHGIKDDGGNLYLASSQTCKHPNGELITSTTVSASFVHSRMNQSSSQRLVIILDCCFSGAFAQGMTIKNDGCIDIKSQLGGEGRVVLTSSTSSQYSFEEQASNHSIYTRYLVEGIEYGKADLDGDGLIAVDELHEYTRAKMQTIAPKSKPEFYSFKKGDKIYLAKACKGRQENFSRTGNQIDFGELNLEWMQQEVNPESYSAAASYLPNFLEAFEFFIQKIIIQLTDYYLSQKPANVSPVSSECKNKLLEIIRYISEADFVYILSSDSDGNCFVKSHSNFSENIDENNYIDLLNKDIFHEAVFNASHHGIYKIQQYGEDCAKTFVMVPLRMPPEAEIMVICGLPNNSYLLQDIYGGILSSFYGSSQQFLEPEFVESAIIDDLKRDFGFVSQSLYKRRFNLFCQRLRKMVVYFEPLICIDVNEFFIGGWEALARDTQTLKAPVDLFKTAELWGAQFKVELDKYFLLFAAKSYKKARKSKQRRLSDVVPLSVNVYPESLIRKTYFETVKIIIEENLISPRNLILEISEKSDLPQSVNKIKLDNPLIYFKNKLLEYVHQFNIRFAIDDFGAGYSSISRLAGLNPCHVKIDSAILHHQSSDLIISFVHKIVKANNLYPPNVIIEGVDKKTPTSLYQLKKIGVTYIQGHLIGKPEPEIYRLSEGKYRELQKMLSGEVI